MKSRFLDLGRLAGNPPFERAELRETVELLSNPFRGWYQIHTFPVDQEPDLEGRSWLFAAEDTLALVLLDIGRYRNQDLDREAVERISRILDFFSDRGYGCIVRAVYDCQGKAPEREPFLFSQVLTHLEQIADIVGRHPCVFVFQGMLVGNWGEMHGSRFLSRDRMRQMADVLRARLSGKVWMAVRRPSQWRQLHTDQAGGPPLCQDGIGLFDDGIFGSESHLGTFGAEPSAAWESPWLPEEELAFEDALCRQAPNGGEVVWGEEMAPERVAAVLRRMHVTYLNRDHDLRLLERWRRQPCPVGGVWAGKSLFDYVGAHLGYRFVVRNVRVKKGRQGGQLVEVEVENTGFSSFYQTGWTALAYMGQDGVPGRARLEGSLTGWASGEVRRLAWEIQAGMGKLLLCAGSGDTPIRFANPTDGEGNVLLGRLLYRRKEGRRI